MTTVFDAVDLSQLPPPEVVEPLSFELILAALKRDFIARFPEFDAFVESDPAIKVMEVAAFRELLLRQRVNDGARAVMLAFARGGDLDNLAALFGLQRLVIDPGDPAALPPREPVLESDTDFRRRVQLSLEASTAAGTAGRYLFFALGSDPLVADASVTSPRPGDVLITIMSREGDGVPSPELLARVDAAMQDEEVRQLNDTVIVAPVTLVPYSIDATLVYRAGAARGAAREASLAALDALLAQPIRIGRPVARSALFDALHVEGISRVILTSPPEDILIAPTEAAIVTEVQVLDG